jgi:hypothetical protein
LILIPGVFGCSIISGSGGCAVPSTESVLAFASLAVIASNDGMFLYPRIFFSVVTGPPTALALSSSCTFSVVNASPGMEAPAAIAAAAAADPAGVGVPEGGAPNAGDSERGVGALAATESPALATVAREAEELVRRRAAAKRGRATGATPEEGAALMRAASWFREGIRELLGRSGLDGASGLGVASVVDVDIVEEVVSEEVVAGDKAATNPDQGFAVDFHHHLEAAH